MPFASIESFYKFCNKKNVPNEKIVIGVATWGHSWIMTSRSNSSGIPPVRFTNGKGPSGPRSFKDGFVSWPEICKVLAKDPLFKKIRDPDEQNGVYSFRPADNEHPKGIWISYEDPQTVAAKATYVRRNSLGGVALFNLNFDDINGECNEERFPLLRSIKHSLNVTSRI